MAFGTPAEQAAQMSLVSEHKPQSFVNKLLFGDKDVAKFQVPITLGGAPPAAAAKAVSALGKTAQWFKNQLGFGQKAATFGGELKNAARAGAAVTTAAGLVKYGVTGNPSDIVPSPREFAAVAGTRMNPLGALFGFGYGTGVTTQDVVKSLLGKRNSETDLNKKYGLSDAMMSIENERTKLLNDIKNMSGQLPNMTYPQAPPINFAPNYAAPPVSVSSAPSLMVSGSAGGGGAMEAALLAALLGGGAGYLLGRKKRKKRRKRKR